LSLKPVKSIGLWSYSIYLVHWPIIVFARDLFPTAESAVWMTTIGALSVVFGWASYYFVERPFRRPGEVLNRRDLFSASLTSLVVLFVGAELVYRNDGFLARLPADIRSVLAYNTYDTDGIYRTGTCFLNADQDWADLDSSCLTTTHPFTLLWGDSHAAHYYEAMKERFASEGIGLAQANMSNCAPMIGFQPASRPFCGSFNNDVLKWIVDNRPDTVVLSAFWYLDDKSLKKLDQTVQALIAAGISTVVIGQSPIYSESVPNILAKRLLRGDHGTTAANNGWAAYADRAMTHRYDGIKGVRYISVEQTFCGGAPCSIITDDGIPTNWDVDHFTLEGARMAVQRMFRGPQLSGYFLSERTAADIHVERAALGAP
jgi:hypothetical protein